MMAILRYAFLKTWRDRSLVALMIWPLLGTLGPWVALTIEHSAGHSGPSPREIADIIEVNVGASALVLGSIFAFWTFRGEMANRSIGAFLFPVRPVTVTASLIIFATAGGLAATLLAGGFGAILFRVLPGSPILSLALKVLVFSFTAAAIGTLAVTISTQPAMLIGSIWGTCALFLIPAIIKAATKNQRLGSQGITVPEYFALLAIAIVCFGLATALLERRCAT